MPKKPEYDSLQDAFDACQQVPQDNFIGVLVKARKKPRALNICPICVKPIARFFGDARVHFSCVQLAERNPRSAQATILNKLREAIKAAKSTLTCPDYCGTSGAVANPCPAIQPANTEEQ